MQNDKYHAPSEVIPEVHHVVGREHFRLLLPLQGQGYSCILDQQSIDLGV